jgi:hypothetical protein
MDLQQRIRKYIETNGSPPWRYGCDLEMSMHAMAAWRALTITEQLIVSRHCPFISERDRLLRKLHTSGVSNLVLVCISGLSSSAVSRIVKVDDNESVTE